MSSAALSAPTTPLLRPHQVREAKEEVQQIENALAASKVISGLHVDRREMGARKKRLTAQLDQLTPRAFPTEQKDAAVARWRTLAESIKSDMPSGEEMRRNPPGARQKQTAWHERHKHEVQEWKNLGLRLREGGDVPAPEFKHEDNVEILRTWRGSHDVSMDHAQIPKKRDIHIGSDIVNTVVFSAEDEARLKELAPALAASLAVLDNDARAQIKALLDRQGSDAADETAPAPDADLPVKPTFKELGYNGMKKLASAHGVECKNIKQADLIQALRARHLIQ